MTSLGDHRRGTAALSQRRPAVLAALLAVSLVISAVAILAFLRVEGDVAKALQGRSKAYTDYSAFEARFGSPSKDEVLLVEAGDLGAADTLVALEDLVIELQLTDGVNDVLSIFSIPDPKGEALSFLARDDVFARPGAARLDAMLAEAPLARQILSADRRATLVTVLPDLSMPAKDRVEALQAAIQTAAPELVTRQVGLAALQREISRALIADQIVLAPAAILVCAVLALLLFRSWQAAVICIVPAVLALGWTFGLMAVAGVPVGPLLAIVPTVLIVLGVADAVHVHHAVMRHISEVPLDQAISLAMTETMPAVVLTTLTTAIAFLSLLAVGSPTLSDLAVIGAAGLGFTLLAVWLAAPPVSALLLAVRPPRRHAVGYRAVSDMAIGLLAHRRAVGVLALALLAGLFVVQTRTVAGFSLTDHVPRGSDFRAALAALDRALPGSDQLFAVIDASDPAPGLQVSDRARLDVASAVLYGDGAVLPQDLGERGRETAASRRVLGPDGARFALPVPARLSDDWRDTQSRAAGVSADLSAAGLGEVSHVTGYSLMAAVELPQLVRELRLAFYLAVLMVTVLAAVLMRSVWLALISLVPNLIPIMGVEAWLVATGQPLTLTGAIALTIAFGIAVDDTIHVLNRLRLHRDLEGGLTGAAMAGALRTVTPPIATTGIVLLAGFALTIFSSLPSVSVFGQLVAGAMALALLADLFLFPALLLWATRRRGAP